MEVQETVVGLGDPLSSSVVTERKLRAIITLSEREHMILRKVRHCRFGTMSE